MAFDQSKDILLHKIGQVQTKDVETTEVNIYSYNNGESKIGVVRHGVGWNDKEYSKGMGRLSYEEAVQIIPLLNEALQKLEDI